MHRRTWEKVCLVILMMILLLLTGCAGKSEGEHDWLEEAEAEGTEEKQEEKEAVSEETKEIGKAQTEDSLVEEDIYVHVCGAVVSPGVYMLKSGSRIYEAVEAAGGLTSEAAGESLNQAAALEDGQQIYVLSKEEMIQGNTTEGMSGASAQGADTQNQDDGKVDLNTASKQQLMTLSGIGEAKAMAIINYREEHGGFRKTEELMEVEGIKEGIYNKIKDQIKI